MAVYRFRVTFEDYEDVSREIEVLGKQSYEDLHRAIQQAIGFDNSKDASFFMSDDYWRKGQEIALKVNDDDDDDDYPKKKKTIRKMSECRVSQFIDDPHQRILYVFDPQARWTLMLELMKILEDDPKASYPRCSKSVGAAPKQYKVKLAPPPEDDEEEEEDEEEKKRKENAFAAVETFDESERPENEEGEEEVIGDSGSEEGGEEAGEEEEGGDFDPGSFGGNEEEF